MPVNETAFEFGKSLGIARSLIAFGPQVLASIDTAEAEADLRNVILSYDNAPRPLHPRFTALFVELGVAGAIARQHTGDKAEALTVELLTELADTLIRALNSLTHGPPTGDED